jgi:drug/metabolite transporter (DMT)-like permease
MPSNPILFLTTVLVWGSTWFAIEFQLGVVEPAVSVAYRFALAGSLLLAWQLFRREPVMLPRAAVLPTALTGLFNFGLNYLLVYSATGHLTSGLVAVAGSALTVMNVLNARLFLGQPVRPPVLVGGAVGVTGVLLLFWPEIAAHGLEGEAMLGLGLVMLGNYCASVGNMAISRARQHAVPLFSITAWAMLTGAALTGMAALVIGLPFAWDPRPGYLATLIYLTLFGSIVAFLSYFTLLGRIGADRAGYVAVMVPLVALVISTVFEGYVWTPVSVIGLLLALGGNVLIMMPADRWPGRRAAAEPVK